MYSNIYKLLLKFVVLISLKSNLFIIKAIFNCSNVNFRQNIASKKLRRTFRSGSSNYFHTQFTFRANTNLEALIYNATC